MPQIDMTKTGQNIRMMRQRAGMTVADMQEICCVSAAAICKWQKGKCLPTIDNMVIMAAAWNCKIDDIVAVM